MNSIRALALVLVSAVVATPARAQDRRVPASGAELRLSYAPIVQRAQPAVVNVYAAKTVQNRNPLLDDPLFRRFFGVPGQQPEQMQRSLGSGVMVDASGLVVTNNHVIEGADQVKISLADKREFEAEIVLKDSRSSAPEAGTRRSCASAGVATTAETSTRAKARIEFMRKSLEFSATHIDARQQREKIKRYTKARLGRAIGRLGAVGRRRTGQPFLVALAPRPQRLDYRPQALADFR